MKKAVFVLLVVTALATASLFLTQASPAKAASVTPVFVAGNPTCQELGYAHEFKVDPPNAGTYNAGPGTITVVTDGVYFDWTSTFGIDAVIAKGGPNANLFVYDPPAESFGDTQLASPINDSNGQPFGLSHISFCFDYELQVSKTATTTFTRTYQWAIDKSVTPETLNMFNGDSGAVSYTVTVTKTGFVDSNWAVSGNITITNPDPSVSATISSVTDEITGGIFPPVNCGVSFPYVLGPGQTLQCTYSSALPDGTSRTNTATAASTGVNGGSGSAAVTFGSPTTEVNATVNVTDSYQGSLGSFSDSGTASYSRTFTCGADEGQHGNTATIVETGQSDSANVTVNCYELSVTKTANTSLERKFNWFLDKSADQSSLVLSIGQTFLVNYSVTVTMTGYDDSKWAVAGNITVTNSAPIAATINSVNDVISGGINASVDCGVSFPYSLAGNGGTLVCSYSSNLPDASSRTNTATATQQNYSYDAQGNATANGTTDYTGSANVDFANASITEIDECVDVVDSFAGNLGTVCANESPKTFTYSRTVGPYSICGNYTVENTATSTTNDTGATSSDSVIIPISVPCVGCTLTPGYWKTHSEFGPAPYDDTWALLPNGASTIFYLSGKTYYQVLWTAPQGNAYYILAHAFIAAKLNVLNGAGTTPAVDAAIASATTFFNTYTPSSTLTKQQRNAIIALANTLDQYNNGLIGPGHCSE